MKLQHHSFIQLLMNRTFILFILILCFTACNHTNSNKKELSEFQAIAHTKEKKLKDSLSFELCKMYGLDQGIRDTKNYDKSVIMPKVDSLNFKRLVSFVKDNGFPNQQLLGTRFAGHECVEFAAMAIMLHNPHRLVNEKEYFDLFFEEVEKGNMPRSFFVDVLDKYYFMKSGWQHAMYGSQFGQPCITTKKQTNKLREEVGLEPLKDEEFKDCD